MVKKRLAFLGIALGILVFGFFYIYKKEVDTPDRRYRRHCGDDQRKIY